MQIEQCSYGGWDNCLEMNNGQVKLIITQVLQFKFERKNEQLNLEKQPLTCYISISYNKLKI